MIGRRSWKVTYWGKWTIVSIPVRGVRYSIAERPDGPAALKVEYRAARQWWPELIKIGDPATRADVAHWWYGRSAAPVPSTAEEAVELAKAGALARPKYAHFMWAYDDPEPRLGDVDVGPIPAWPAAAAATAE